MTVYSDKHVKDSELEYTTNGYSIALDAVLDIAGNADQLIMNKLYNYENPRESYKDMWYGVLINTELQDFKRRVPNKEIIAQKNERKDLHPSRYLAGSDSRPLTNIPHCCLP